MVNASKYEVIVVGGGHAGTEAAMAAARLGVKTLLLTDNLDTVGAMSCNPAIGGIGKGHLVKEIDALGGVMAQAADLAGIQFRVLNSSKGPAVRATRAQADRSLYKNAVRVALENQSDLFLFQQSVSDLIIDNDQVSGVVTRSGIHFYAPAVVLTVGTFLGGVIHIGLEHFSGGRAGENASIPLASRLRELPFQVARLKTGTPPRVDSRSIDYSILTRQAGDTPLPVFSFIGHAEQHPRQVFCHIARTTTQTHDIIRQALSQSPMYTGMIEGVGPRYCPSIEDKVVRFSDKDSHQIFVEPEGLNTHEIYPNGISTSLPYEVQYQFVRSIPGFENAHIMRPGYAIEYDFFDPRGLKSSLETQVMPGLFFAGQINGTTGYEEAAAQGLLAGLNAARRVRGQESWCPGREEAYLGVMVDDLITHGTQEPYRMFTSRAEYRLLLREDNADLRLTAKGRELGLIDDLRWKIFQRKCEAIECLQSNLRATWMTAGSDQAKAISQLLKKPLMREANLHDLLRRPEVRIEHLRPFSDVLQKETNQQVMEQVEIQTKYAGYVERQHAEVIRTRRYQNTQLPDDLDYSYVQGLSNEVREKLQQQRPETIGQASRIPGMTPAAISLLLIYLKKQHLTKKIA